MVMLQPVSGLYIVEEFVKTVGIEDGYDKFDQAVHERTGFHLSEQSPLKHVKSVTVSTLVAQGRGGAVVVLRAGESPAHGEGRQRLSRREGHSNAARCASEYRRSRSGCPGGA